MAAASRTAQWLTAADGARHPLIEISSDSSDDEVAAGSCDTLAPLDPAAAQPGDASEDDEGEEKAAVVLSACTNNIMFCLKLARLTIFSMAYGPNASAKTARLSVAFLPFGTLVLRVPRPYGQACVTLWKLVLAFG